MKTYTVTLASYSESTNFDIDLSDSEYRLLKTIEKAVADKLVGLTVRVKK